jgi:uncharacterized protein (TIGR03437 family)
MVRPVRMGDVGGVVAVAGGDPMNLALKDDGTVWSIGYPGIQKVAGLSNVVAVDAGTDYGLALKADGTVWQLDLALKATQVTGLAGIVAVAMGAYDFHDWFAQKESLFHAMALKEDGTVWTWTDVQRPAPMEGLTGVVAIAAGYDHHLALRNDGTVWAWGGNSCGQSGGGFPASWASRDWSTPHKVDGIGDVTAISANGNEFFYTIGHSMALRSDGTVWEWGCGLSSTLFPSPTPLQVSGVAGIVAIAAGSDHSLALQEDGAVWAWGYNDLGQLGDGTNTTEFWTPVKVQGLPPLISRPALKRVANAASFVSGPVAPGEIVSVFGKQIGGIAGSGAIPNAEGVFDGTLAGTRVLFDGVAAPLLFAQADQVNAVVPYALEGKSTTEIQVEYRGVMSIPQKFTVAESALGIFTVDASGAGQGMVLNEDGSLNSASRPAQRSSTVTIFATGEGQTSPPGVDGKVAAAPLPRPLLPVSVQIGGQEAQVVEAASAPGMAGVLQVKVRVPESVAAGSATPVTLKAGSAQSQAGLTVAVQ